MRATCLCRTGCARLSAWSRSRPNLRPALDKSQRHFLSNESRRFSPAISSSRLASRIHHGAQSQRDTEWPANLANRFTVPTTLSSQSSNAVPGGGSADRGHRTPSSPTQLENIVPTNTKYARRTSRFHNRPSSSTTSSRRNRGGIVSGKPKTKRRPKIGHDMYMQWGYLRHQKSGAELKQMRKAFNSWKAKFQRIMRHQNPAWPWKGDEQWLQDNDSVSSIQSAWQSLDEDSRAKKWPRIMLSTMCLYPEKVSMILEATLDSWPPGYAINDTLLFMVQRLDLSKVNNIREKTLRAEEVFDLLHKVIVDSPKQHIPFSQRLFGLFAKKLPSEQAFELYTLLQRLGFRLHANTLIQFASKLASDPAHKPTAFGILQALSDSGADLNEARPSSVITSLLHCKAPEADAPDQNHEFSAKDALQYFIEKGFTLNLLSATAFLDTLCQQGEVDEAIRLALLFSESIQLDTRAWVTVFRGAKLSRNVETIAKALDLAKVADVPFVDVLNNTLHSAFQFAEVEAAERKHQVPFPSSLFGTLLRIYAKKFDLEPLQWWLPDSLPLIMAQATASHQGLIPGDPSTPKWQFESTIVPFVDQLFSSGDDTKLQPNLTTIAIMMRAYIRSLRHPYDLLAYYQFFKSRLEDQSKDPSLPSAKRLIKNQRSLIHDTLILAMTEHKELSRPALQIFGDMLKDQLQRLKNASSDTTSKSNGHVEIGDGIVAAAPVHPAPTVLTFTILLRGLMNNRDRVLIEQVIQIMHENGVEPNLVTWNTLTSGYAAMQDVPKTVSTLQDMEAAGFKPNLYTFKAFGRLRNQTQALQMMEDMIDLSRRKMSQDVYE